MRRRLELAAALGLAAIGSWSAIDANDPQIAPTTVAAAPHIQTVTTYCLGCHNDRSKTGGLSLASPDLGNVAADPDTWEKVLLKVRGGMMPPPGAAQPDATTRQAL